MRGVLTLALLACAAPLAAQTPGLGGRLVYEAAFFARFAPSNALQIVQRTPGFTLERVDEEVRGFGVAAGNVVINGQRPSAKSDTLETILSRIPANRVARVEVGGGDLFSAEYTGKPQVLNLVLTDAGGLAGTAVGTLRRDFTGRLYPEGTVSGLLRRGKSTFNAAVMIDNEATVEEGYDRVRTLADQALTEYRRKTNRIRDPNGALTASWEYDGGTNRTAHLNGRYAIDRFQLAQVNAVSPAAGPMRDDRLSQRYDLDELEIGGDVMRPLAGGGLKLIGLVNRRQRDRGDLQLLRVAEATIGGGEQILKDKRAETVARLVWSRAGLHGWQVEMGGEGVVNRLKSDLSLFDLDGSGARTRIDLPIDQATVKEYRGEAFINAGRPLSPTFRMDLALNYEMSRLSVTGDAQAKRTLRFVKPKAVLDWRVSKVWHLQVSLQRTVAQLQFEDFISGAELTTDRVNGGNANLLPQRAWELLGFVERPILADGLFRIEAGYNAVEQVQDRVPTPEGFDAPGNLGSGREIVLRSKLDAPLGRFGVPGGRLTLYGSYVESSVKDPYTGRARPFSGNSKFLFEANFRQDLGNFAWGIGLEGSTPSTFYRRNELDRNWRELPVVTAFAEYRPTARTTLTLGLENATGAPAFRRRTFFAPDRGTPAADLLELRKRNLHIVPYLTAKHSF
jgi:hypothetical protein